MRAFILDIARDLYREFGRVDIDEVASTCGIKTAHLLFYFPTSDDLRNTVADELLCV